MIDNGIHFHFVYHLVPSWYFSNLDMSGRRVDMDQRPELRYGSVEFAVPAEYNSSRTPAPLNYVFAIDVSAQAVRSGMVQAACNAIKHALYGPNTSKLAAGNKIGLLTFDRSVHFYNLAVTFIFHHATATFADYAFTGWFITSSNAGGGGYSGHVYTLGTRIPRGSH